MRTQGLRGSLALAAMLAITACGKQADTSAPLAFVPNDTPYVLANVEAVPEASRARFEQQARAAWPVMLGIFDQAIADIGKAAGDDASDAERAKAASVVRVMKAVVDEIRERDTPEKWRELGIGQDARAALYGVGLLPVLRLELADPAAFRATVARIEQNAGSQLATAQIGEQALWTIGSPEIEGVMAIQGQHLVLGLLPGGADEALKRRVLGLERPAQSLADSDAMDDFNAARGYLPYGSGWIDTRRVVALIGEDAGVAALARAAGSEPPTLDATCRTEFDALAAKAPRLAFGYTAFDATRMSMHARIDLEPELAKSLLALGGSLPGAASKDALLDFAIVLPVLGLRDLLLAQTEAVAAAPFKCDALTGLNDGFAEMKPKLEGMIPPPVANLAGLRMSASQLDWPQGADKPAFSGHLVLNSENPAMLVGFAQMALPALQKVMLLPDGKPVAVPADVLPAAYADIPLSVAMGEKTLALAIGKDETARLASVIGAAPAKPGTWLEMSYSGRIYTLFGDAIQRFGSLMPDEQRQQFEAQRALYAMYAKWFKRFEVQVAVVAEGIDLTETIEFTDP